LILLGGALLLACAGCAVGETGSSGTISASTATVSGRVVSTVGGPVEYWVQYGLTTSYGSQTAHQTVGTSQDTAVAVTVEIGGLARATRYHYRLCASDSEQGGNPGCGDDRTLTTQSFACGETVAASVRLTGDLACGDTALVIGANGIDVNLAGHRIMHSVLTPMLAIDNRGGYDDVTIRNGRLDGTIALEGASRNVMRDLDIVANPAGVQVSGGEGNQIRASSVAGVRLSAVAATGTSGLVIANSRLESGESLASTVQVDGDGARIVRNEVSHPGAPGPVSGIELTGSGGRIVDNQVTGPNWNGGIVVLAGSDDVVSENEVTGATLPTGSQDGRLGDGIFIGPFAAGTLLRDNRADDNQGDGIQVQDSGARLGGNGATGNGDFGIDAAPGVTDLGGNFASGNGNPLQCRNVFCP
jgi:hypothetical protein